MKIPFSTWLRAPTVSESTAATAAAVLVTLSAGVSMVPSGTHADASAPSPRAPLAPHPTPAPAPRLGPKSARPPNPRPARGCQTTTEDRSVTVRTVSADVPAAVDVEIDRAINAFNCAGAAVRLERERDGGDIVVEMVDGLPGSAIGRTRVECAEQPDLPCRPQGAVEVRIERGLDHINLSQTVVHELGHALGLAHDHSGCSAMFASTRVDQPCAHFLARRVLSQRDIAALRKIWGAASSASRRRGT